MVIILMLVTISSSFHELLPVDIEAVISMGQRNVNRFRERAEQLEWHVTAPARLERARKASDIRGGLGT
jgi:hypothetical protein